MDQIAEIARTRKPRGQGATRRGEILDAAKHLFAEQGVDHVTMRRIGAAVGVSPTALYMHFSDKDALLAAIALDTFAEIVARLEQSRRDMDTPLKRLRAGLRAYIDFGLARPDEYRLTFMTRLFRRSNVKTCALELADRSFHILEDGVRELMAAGVFRDGNVTLVSEAIWATLHGVTALLLDQAENIFAKQEALIEASLDLLIAGLLRPESSDAAK